MDEHLTTCIKHSGLSGTVRCFWIEVTQTTRLCFTHNQTGCLTNNQFHVFFTQFSTEVVLLKGSNTDVETNWESHIWNASNQSTTEDVKNHSVMAVEIPRHHDSSGDHICRATPVPISNTVVKPAEPMIVTQ